MPLLNFSKTDTKGATISGLFCMYKNQRYGVQSYMLKRSYCFHIQ